MVLPHILRSGIPPSHNVPIPVCKKHSYFTLLYKPFHVWWLTGPLHRSRYVNIQMDKESYTLGDTVRDTVLFPEDFNNARIKVYSVFQYKSQHHYDTSEQEQLLADTRCMCYKGSEFSFSGLIPRTGYPTFATRTVSIQWRIRAVVKTPFAFANVVEKRLRVRPLLF